MDLPDLTTQKDRLRWAAERVGAMSAAQLARLVGNEEPTARSNLNGTRTFSRAAAIRYGEKLGVPWAWLLEGNRDGMDFGEPSHLSLREDAQHWPYPDSKTISGTVEIQGKEFTSIPRFDASLSAGPGSIMGEQPEPLGHHLIETQWLRAVTRAAPEQLAILQVDGDSMETTLMDDDWVLIDRTQLRLNRTGIYALQVNDTAWVKRIELDLETKLIQLISDNPKYPIRRLPEDELSVLGRVVWVVGRRV